MCDLNVRPIKINNIVKVYAVKDLLPNWMNAIKRLSS